MPSRLGVDALPYVGEARVFREADAYARALQSSVLVCESAHASGKTAQDVIVEHGGRRTKHVRTWRQALCIVRDYYIQKYGRAGG